MREELEALERALESYLEELYSRPVSERYNDMSTELLEMELNHVGSCFKTMKRFTSLVRDYYNDISNELVERENANAV